MAPCDTSSPSSSSLRHYYAYDYYYDIDANVTSSYYDLQLLQRSILRRLRVTTYTRSNVTADQNPTTTATPWLRRHARCGIHVGDRHELLRQLDEPLHLHP